MRLLLLVVLLVVPAPADAAPDGPVPVTRALAGNLLELADSRLVRLAGIRLPAEASVRRSNGLDARAALAGLIEGRAVRLEPAGEGSDRHGRLVAQVFRNDGLWLQGALLDRGLVQVQTRPGEAARAAEMMDREEAARRAGIGLWAEPGFAPRPTGRLGAAVGSFQIVEGRVLRVAPTERYLYLNFGSDWRTDFTLRVARSSERSFLEAGIDLEHLAGRDVEVRGYVLAAGGPLIELSHPEQIRIRPEADR